MLPSYRIAFETVTPIWTGDTRQRSAERMLETGIAGSLRWWAEAIARWRGYDLDSERAKASSRAEENPIVQVFGNTDWARDFRLVIRRTGEGRDERWRGGRTFAPVANGNGSVTFSLPNTSRNKRDKPATWQFGSQAQHGCFELELSLTSAATAERLYALVELASRWGGLGAKAASGCGVIAAVGRPTAECGDMEGILEKWMPAQGATVNSSGNPQWDEFYFQEYSLPTAVPQIPGHPEVSSTDQHWPFAIRQKIRDGFRKDGGTDLRHQLCGEGGKNPHGSHIFVSFPYRKACVDADAGVVRIWGWLPQGGIDGNSNPMIRGRISAIVESMGLRPVPRAARTNSSWPTPHGLETNGGSN